MKRTFFTVAIAFAALFALSNTGTNAITNTFAERFSIDAKKVKMGESGVYSFDKAHSFIGFKIKHMGLIEVPGFFREFTGDVNFDAADVTRSTVSFKAMTTSIDTGVVNRDKHLRTADFFEVEKFPELTFNSTKVAKKGKGWMLTGDLTIKGVTKSVALPFQIVGWLPADDRSGGKMGIAAETTINRRDFGVNYGSNLPSGIAVSDEVKIVLQIEAGKPKANAAVKSE